MGEVVNTNIIRIKMHPEMLHYAKLRSLFDDSSSLPKLARLPRNLEHIRPVCRREAPASAMKA